MKHWQAQQCHITKSVDEPTFSSQLLIISFDSPVTTQSRLKANLNQKSPSLTAFLTVHGTSLPVSACLYWSSTAAGPPQVRSIPHSPTSVSPASASAKPISTSSSHPAETCGPTPKKREHGLDYHRNRRRLLHDVPCHDHIFFYDNY